MDMSKAEDLRQQAILEMCSDLDFDAIKELAKEIDPDAEYEFNAVSRIRSWWMTDRSSLHVNEGSFFKVINP